MALLAIALAQAAAQGVDDEKAPPRLPAALSVITAQLQTRKSAIANASCAEALSHVMAAPGIRLLGPEPGLAESFDNTRPRCGEPRVATRMFELLFRHSAGAMIRHWPFANGSGRLIDMTGSIFQYASGPQRCVASDGFDMTVLGEDLIGRHILISGQFDRSIFKVLLDLAEPGDTLLDIGANIGYATCLFLALVPGTKVIAVEPQPEIADLFRINAEQFGDRAKLIEAGLWDLPGTGWLMIDKLNRGASKVQDAQSDAAFKVPLLDAAAFFAAQERVDLIKIDIEGAEVRVLQAAKTELARLRPRAILFEDHHVLDELAPGIAPIPRLMETLGYECFAVQKTLFSTKLVPLAKAKRLRTHDFLAVRR